MKSVLVRTAFPHRRTKIIVGIGYDESHEQARRILMGVLKNTEGVLDEPAPDVNVVELADSSVNIKLLYWTDSQQSSTRKTADRVVSGQKPHSTKPESKSRFRRELSRCITIGSRSKRQTEINFY